MKAQKTTSKLKHCEHEHGVSYIGFQEDMKVPGHETLTFRFECDKKNSPDDVKKLISVLHDHGFALVVQTP
ncbi:hypothetical protein RBSWK_01419 [Rhodopirellula baltica SWK14]|uniref:Uncharacterized protein n=1 Tax=Rhodopirellula baltica SWK14 TaxID=993516 RepID=L7CLY0_RHOBT|nr:hypothetical protein RBSWK_01419 [Rhodopirellula baltica SWK14]